MTYNDRFYAMVAGFKSVSGYDSEEPQIIIGSLLAAQVMEIK